MSSCHTKNIVIKLMHYVVSSPWEKSYAHYNFIPYKTTTRVVMWWLRNGALSHLLVDKSPSIHGDVFSVRFEAQSNMLRKQFTLVSLSFKSASITMLIFKASALHSKLWFVAYIQGESENISLFKFPNPNSHKTSTKNKIKCGVLRMRGTNKHAEN